MKAGRILSYLHSPVFEYSRPRMLLRASGVWRFRSFDLFINLCLIFDLTLHALIFSKKLSNDFMWNFDRLGSKQTSQIWYCWHGEEIESRPVFYPTLSKWKPFQSRHTKVILSNQCWIYANKQLVEIETNYSVLEVVKMENWDFRVEISGPRLQHSWSWHHGFATESLLNHHLWINHPGHNHIHGFL